MPDPLRVVILKPSKYMADGYVERFRWGFMPNSTVPYMRSMTPAEVGGTPVERPHASTNMSTPTCDICPCSDGRGAAGRCGAGGRAEPPVSSRRWTCAAYARGNGCLAVIGGPHVMTCDTSMLHGRGVASRMAEAELVWPEILHDAVSGRVAARLRPRTGGGSRSWTRPVVVPPSRSDLGRYIIPMLGLYPARGCPFLCNFCSVIKIAGRRIRSQSIATTLASLRAAKAAGVRKIMFTLGQLQQVPGGRGAAGGHGGGAARSGASSCSATRRSPGKSS